MVVQSASRSAPTGKSHAARISDSTGAEYAPLGVEMVPSCRSRNRCAVHRKRNEMPLRGSVVPPVGGGGLESGAMSSAAIPLAPEEPTTPVGYDALSEQPYPNQPPTFLIRFGLALR